MTTSPVTTAAPNQPVARRLAGARVVVTGGAWGVGAEIAARLDGCFVPADLADDAFLASPASDYLTGQASNVCGGMHLG